MKNSILKIVLIYAITYSLYSCEKDDGADIDVDKWSVYTEEDGLVSENINTLCVDQSDVIWIGTNMGVTTYDGSNFYTYPNFMASPIITSIAMDPDNNIWVGSFGGGLAMLDGNKWVNYQYDENSANCLASNYVLSISFDASGNIWVGTSDKGVSMWDGQKWTNYTINNGLVDNYVCAISIDKQGNKWFGTNSGISKFDGNSCTNYSYDQIAGNGVVGIAIDKTEEVWLATWGGISMLKNNVWTNFTTETNWLVADSPVLSVTVDNDNNKWFGSNGWGISKFDGEVWTTYDKVNEASISSVHAIVIDSKGTKWFGTSTGLIKFEE
nr:two-component regulator propeller domain-containing protein [uncultured Carboxylicivirga sp.]